MSKVIDLTGQRFGRLTAIEYAGKDNQMLTLWRCICDCGKEITTRASSLKCGNTQSCGCLQAENTKVRATTHGLTGGRSHANRLYSIWRNMKQRCYNPKAAKYNNYGGRGIAVCEEWINSYVSFHEWAMANGYSDNLTLDRIENNGNYEPLNCRWSTNQEQSNNTRFNRLLTYNEETKTLAQWADEIGLNFTTLKCRLDDYGWDLEKALNAPVGKHQKRIIQYNGKTQTLNKWSKELGINYKLLCGRLLKGWSIERAFTQPIKGAKL